MGISEKLVIEKLPKRPRDANKGTFGKSLIIAGSKNYPGAAILSVLAAARSGAGLITLATNEDVYQAAVPKIPFATFLSFPEIETNLEKYDSVLIGPGLGKSPEVKQLINKLISLEDLRTKRLALDADCLNILSESKDWYKTLEVNSILTPHPGEMSRLTNLSIDEIQKDRGEVTKKYAKLWNKTIVLKGAETIIANPQGEVYKSNFANPLLATAGTGDALSGMITALLAQGLNLTDAAICGVYIHGLAGEKLKPKFGVTGTLATDLIEVLPEILKDLYLKSDELSKHPRQFV